MDYMEYSLFLDLLHADHYITGDDFCAVCEMCKCQIISDDRYSLTVVLNEYSLFCTS